MTVERTPEARAAEVRQVLFDAAKILALVAHGNGVTDDRIKAAILALRSPEIRLLPDEVAADPIQYLELTEA